MDLPADLQRLVRHRARTRPGRSPSWSPNSSPGQRGHAGRPAVGRAVARASAATSSTSHRLVYLAESLVNWCPGLGTVLANEEVTADGRSDRGNFPVFRRNLRQWMMRITAYSDRLLDDLDRAGLAGEDQGHAAQLDRPVARRATCRFRSPASATIEVFTTRPDTLFGATYMVLAPGAPVGRRAGARRVARGRRRAVDRRCRDPGRGRRRLSAGDRRASPTWSARRARTRPACSSARTPRTRSNGKQIPVFIADYVLMGYGTGAIMAVPGERPARLGVRHGVRPADRAHGRCRRRRLRRRGVHRRRRAHQLGQRRTDLNGLSVADGQGGDHRAAGAPTATARARVEYKLRDWLFARQRYWGEPFPIVYDADGRAASRCPRSVLPVELPDIDDYSPVHVRPRRRRQRARAAAGAGRPTGWRSSWTSATGLKTTAATPT